MKTPKKRTLTVVGGVLLVVYFLAIAVIARIPGNLDSPEGPAFGPKLIIWMGEGDEAERFADASIVHASTSSLLETVYAPLFRAAKFDKTGEPNFVARWIFGIDFNLSEPPPTQEK